MLDLRFAHAYASNRLLAEDAAPAVVTELRQRFHGRLLDRDGRAPGAGQGRFRMLEKTPKNSLRIAFLVEAFPEARFVFLYRDPRQVLASMLEAWKSGRFKTYAGLPGCPLEHWSLLLTPGWRSLAGKPLIDIVAGQWQAATEVLLGDLASVRPDRCVPIRYDDFVAEPAAQVARLCAVLGLDWDRPLGGTLPLARHTVTRPDPEKWRTHAAAIDSVLPALAATIARAEQAMGDRARSRLAKNQKFGLSRLCS